MTKGFSVKDAKIKLMTIIEELDKFNDDTKFFIELNDNCGGSYVDDMSKWNVHMNLVGECWLSNC